MRCVASNLLLHWLSHLKFAACVDQLDFSGSRIACKAWTKGGTRWNVEAHVLHTSQLQPRCNINSIIFLDSTRPHCSREPWLLYDAVSVISWAFCVLWFAGLAACHERKNELNCAVWTILTARKSLKCHHLALTLQIFIDHLQHLPQNHNIYLHAGEDAGYLTGCCDNQHRRTGVLKSQISSSRTSTFNILQHPDNSFNTESEPTCDMVFISESSLHISVNLSMVYIQGVWVYMTLYECTAYWLFTVNVYANIICIPSSHWSSLWICEVLLEAVKRDRRIRTMSQGFLFLSVRQESECIRVHLAGNFREC